MKKIIFGAGIYFCAAFAAFGHGYYEAHTPICDEASMRRALDDAAAQSRAVITVIKCEPVKAPAPAPRVVRPVRHVHYADYVGPMCDYSTPCLY